MSFRTFERVAMWLVYILGFALIYIAVYRTDAISQIASLIAGTALMRLSGYIDGSSERY